ncbi:MAG: hypothetical protein WCK78_08140 [Paludibacter sp.]
MQNIASSIHFKKKKRFIPDYLKSMVNVAWRFKTTNTKTIVDISHDEDIWTDNHENRKLIPYSYTFKLKAK